MVGRGLDVLRYRRLSIAVRCRAAMSVSSRLTSRGGSEPVMRDPTLIFAADELLSFLAQAERRARYAPANQWPRSGRRSQRQLAAAAERGSWPSSINRPARPARLPRRSLLACSGGNRVVLADIPRCSRFSADFGWLLPSERTAGRA